MCSTIGVRWDGQRADGSGEQALLGLDGLVRSVRSPEFDGVTFHEVHAKSVLNRVPGDSPMPFRWTINPYRGCSHACTYCLSGETKILMGDGRTKSLAATILVYALFTGAAAFSTDVWMLAIFRFLAGIGVGGEWAMAGTYVAEAWPEDRRKMGAGYLQTGYYLASSSR